MLIHRFMFAFAAFALLSAALPCYADSTVTESEAPYSHGLWLDVGLGSTSGFYGAQYGYRAPWMGLGAFVGSGLSGTQVGTSLRAFPCSYQDKEFRSSLVIEGSYALAVQNDPSAAHQFREGLWHWAHLGVGSEMVLPYRFSILLLTGASMVVDGPGDGNAHVDVGDITLFKIKPRQLLGPWMRLSLGYLF